MYLITEEVGMRFRDRLDAGAQLAWALEQYRDQRPVVIGLPRGGVVTAVEVARHLVAPLDIIVAKKISHPLSPEYAIGAVTEAGPPVWGYEADEVGNSWRFAHAGELQQRVVHTRRLLQGSRPPHPLGGRLAIIVDDGIATGLTMEAAAAQARRRGAAKVVVAAPVAPPESRSLLAPLADEVVVLYEPRIGFGSVGQYYDDFEEVEDEEVRQILLDYHKPPQPTPSHEPIDLASLNAVLATIKRYPVSSTTIAKQARQLQAPRSVVGFFESIPGGATFTDQKDIINRSMEAEILMEEELAEPPESPREED
jgi:putative phosphoribosyl transferase